MSVAHRRSVIGKGPSIISTVDGGEEKRTDLRVGREEERTDRALITTVVSMMMSQVVVAKAEMKTMTTGGIQVNGRMGWAKSLACGTEKHMIYYKKEMKLWKSEGSV